MEKVKIDTEKLSVSIGDTPIANQVKKISFDWIAGKRPAIVIELDGEVMLDGIMLKDATSKIFCPKCGRLLGEIVGPYNFDCPNCGCNCYGY